jgi:hypothetical protein
MCSSSIFSRACAASRAVIEPLESRVLCSDGNLDATFGQGGLAVVPRPDTSEDGTTVVGLPNGKVLWAGGTGDSALLACLNADGTLDTAFGTGGLTVVPSVEKLKSLRVLGDGTILAAADA